MSKKLDQQKEQEEVQEVQEVQETQEVKKQPAYDRNASKVGTPVTSTAHCCGR